MDPELERLIDDEAEPGRILLELLARYTALDEGLAVDDARARVFEIISEDEAEVIVRLTLAAALAPVTLAATQLAWARGLEGVEEIGASVVPAAQAAITPRLIERSMARALVEARVVYEDRRTAR